MADYGLNRNHEGYADPTAAEAIKGMPKPGEIWKYKGLEILIVKNMGGYSSILTLSGDPGKDKNIIEVAGRYAPPGKLNYALNDRMAYCVARISDAEFQDVLDEIAAALGLARKSQKPATVAFAVHKDMEAENKALKKRINALSALYDDLMEKFLEKVSTE